MTPMSGSSTISSSELKQSLQVIEVKPGKRFSVATLRSLLPDVETLLFFAKVYGLDAGQLGALLGTVLKTDLANALFNEAGEHSSDLQDYLLDGYEDEYGDWHEPIISPAMAGELVLSPEVPHGEILPQTWEQLEVDIATSIKEVAAKLESVVDKLPGKQGELVFKTMMKMNARRPTLGVHQAQVVHAPQKQNLVVLDASGSMSESTIAAIIDDVVALSYKADAAMAVVSNTTTFWEPGSYDVDTVLFHCEYGGTHYETLADLLNRDWGTVICVADYDSSYAAKRHIRTECHGNIDLVLDVSLVNQPTFLAECVGQRAAEVRPILMATSAWALS